MIRLSFHDLNCSSLFQDSRLDVHPSFIVFGMLTFQLYPKSGPHRVSNNSSHAPSSFSNKSRKRVRLSSPITTPDHSRPPSAAAVNNPNANTSWSSKSSRATSVQIQHSQHSRPSSHRATMSAGPSTSVAHGTVHSSRHQKTRSISQASIPLSAIVSPRAPSVEHLSKFHMRDPRKPRRRPVGWGLRFGTPDDVGSPLHAWCFWLGLLFPLLWWFASFAPIPKTRFVGIGAGQGVNTSADSAEKGITIDDPHVERGAFFFQSLISLICFLLLYFFCTLSDEYERIDVFFNSLPRITYMAKTLPDRLCRVFLHVRTDYHPSGRLRHAITPTINLNAKIMPMKRPSNTNNFIRH